MNSYLKNNFCVLIIKYSVLIVLLISLFSISVSTTKAASADPTTDISSPSFKLIVCDGPVLPPRTPQKADYVPCDFNGLMKTVQHFLDIAIILGVLMAIYGFMYAGYLYISGGNNPGKRTEASNIFRKVFFGFVIILSAWFIVYQILSWLTNSSSYAVLLGS